MMDGRSEKTDAASPIVPLSVLCFGLLTSLVGYVFIQQSAAQSQANRNIETNEGLAQLALHSLVDAEHDFREGDLDKNGNRDYWTADIVGLYQHGALGSLSIARADAKPIRPLRYEREPYFGYYFVAMTKGPDGEDYQQVTDEMAGKVHHPSRFGFCAYPVQYGVTGRRCFLITEEEMLITIEGYGEPILILPDRLSSILRGSP